ncbi:glycoside hydrolase family 30 protein [Bipolaris victoriae FI3]|uniref:Glycoside hydrolase family 30 protein n=1 Tax=Bipolaris victoriae (strain FI3) TaxID=930091 RepID=W7DR27_BIPV3|nr:glycoside hydrolase family 30 protein [Bipolaris victoriae FI3]
MLSKLAFVLASANVALAAPALDSLDARQAVTIAIDSSKTYQTIDGFGISQFYGRAANIKSLAPAAQKQTLDLLFSPTAGAGFNILRNGIGSGPSSGYSIEPNSPGSPTGTPKYQWDGADNDQVWLTQQAQTRGLKLIYADAWSAPGYMKSNGKDSNGGYLCGVTGTSCGNWTQAYANYLTQYVRDYKKAGISITHLGFLNEPDYTTAYSSMLSDGAQAAEFIKVLAPTVKAAGLDVKLTCCDATGYNVQKTMLTGLGAVDSLYDVVTTHGYSSDPTAPFASSKHAWMTETADLSGKWTTSYYTSGGKGEGQTWAEKIYTALVNANFSAYLYWEGAEDAGTSPTNSALINLHGGVVTPSKRFWVYAQWSRFVRPGAVRIGASASTSSLKVSAFKNTDGSVAVQVLNTGASAATVSVSGVKGTASAYITSESHTLDAMTGTSVPAHSMVTFLYK